jgi:hypothetical protein
MLRSYASLVRSCRPLTIVAQAGDDGFRIGGNPPKGITPSVVNTFTRYFATIPFMSANRIELSLFSSFADDYNDPAWLDTNMGMLHSQESVLVQFVVHKAAHRANRSRYEAEFAAQALRLEDERPDNPRKESNRMWIHHKIGGFPFFYNDDATVGANKLLADGYLHLLQMASPGFEDALPEGNWPFGNYMFHVFAKETSHGLNFRYIWA